MSIDNTITLDEDTTHTFTTAELGISDTEIAQDNIVRIKVAPENGTFTYAGVLAITDNFDLYAFNLGYVTWKPDANDNGNGLATFTYTVLDLSRHETVEHTITFNVTPVPDAPTSVDSTITLQEDGSHTFAAADFGFGDVDGDTFASITITALPANGTLTLNGNAVTANEEIAAADIGHLVWTPAANANGDGLTSLGFTVKDSSGSSSASTYTLSFDVTSVNDLPTSEDKTVTLLENGSHTFATADFAFTDVEDQALSSITVTALPGSGSLTLNGTAVDVNDVIAAADISKLVWTPASDAVGDDLASLQFKVTDADGGSSNSAYTIHFDVDSINHAPRAVNDSASGLEGKAVTFNVTANDKDVDGDHLHVTQASVTSHDGTVAINDAGKLVVNYDGPDLDPGATYTVKVQYSVSDGTAEDTASLSVTFTGVAEPGDDINGTPDADTLKGTNAGEEIRGYSDNDIIKAMGGNDSIHAGDGDDIVSGGDGNDFINGMNGNDTIRGDAGKDQIYGGSGDDTLTGGADADRFYFLHKAGHDTITDFQATGKGHDVIDLTAFDDLDFKSLQAMMVQDGKDVVITISDASEITLHNVHLADLGKADFAL